MGTGEHHHLCSPQTVVGHMCTPSSAMSPPGGAELNPGRMLVNIQEGKSQTAPHSILDIPEPSSLQVFSFNRRVGSGP